MQIIIAEKSTAAETIAKNLGEGKIKSEDSGPVKFWTTKINGEESVVIPLKGHIKEVRYPEKFKDWKKSDLYEMINAELIYYPSAEENIEVIKRYAKKADKAIIATDYDTEGEAIGFEAIEVIKSEKKDIDIKRGVFSSLTTKELLESFNNLKEPDKNLADSANARREIDLVLGAVLTRFVSLASERLGNSFLSVGRVQTPTLTLIVDREAERRVFKPETYWEFKASIELGKNVFQASSVEGKIFKKAVADRLRKIKSVKKAIVDDVSKRLKEVSPPKPFNTTGFLRSASAIGFSIPNAMRIVQGLYMKGYVSYPRTDNETYPPTLDIKDILKELAASKQYEAYVNEIISRPLSSTSGKTAKDHPPIHPVKLPKERLPPQDAKIFDLIARRFLATLSKPSKEEIVGIKLDVGGEKFEARGSRIISAGWREVYTYSKYEENILPDIEKGKGLKVKSIDETEAQTTPPSHYSQGGIIKLMEELNLGTKSTRPEILKKLMERRYISSSRTLYPSEMAFAVIENLKNISEDITSAKFTATLEGEMKRIELGEKSKNEVVKEAEDTLKVILNKLEKKKPEIKELMHKALLQQYIFGKCPKSGGNLKMIISKKTHKRFVGCSDYPKCHFGMPLPQSGYMFISPQTCPKCGIHMIEWRGKEVKRTYIFCVNPPCKQKKEPGKTVKNQQSIKAKTEN
ncbi:DNA topoisomerase I [Candidatus Parvarchaeota archaeon]|nr:DNA topoisomerase I [Candidatus Parvarchaeota archaeon]